MRPESDQVERFVFDACALIAYLNDESGADKVESLLDQARRGGVQLHVASVNIYEVFYDCLKRNEATAGNLVGDLYDLPLTVVETLDRSLMRAAGWFKVTYGISLADSIALGLTQELHARLASTDHHELDPIERDGKMRFH